MNHKQGDEVKKPDEYGVLNQKMIEKMAGLCLNDNGNVDVEKLHALASFVSGAMVGFGMAMAIFNEDTTFRVEDGQVTIPPHEVGNIVHRIRDWNDSVASTWIDE